MYTYIQKVGYAFRNASSTRSLFPLASIHVAASRNLKTGCECPFQGSSCFYQRSRRQPK